MDIQKNIEFYSEIASSYLCKCVYCKNYIHEIEATYPQLSSYLKNIGIDITKPFEVLPLNPEPSGYIDYIGAQYIVLGDSQYFQKATIADVTIDITTSHPGTNINEKHFVIEISPIRLKWVLKINPISEKR